MTTSYFRRSETWSPKFCFASCGKDGELYFMDDTKKRGRPLKDGSKKFRCEIRMTEEERDMLKYLAYKTDMSQTDLVNKAIKMLYNLEKYRD